MTRPLGSIRTTPELLPSKGKKARLLPAQIKKLKELAQDYAATSADAAFAGSASPEDASEILADERRAQKKLWAYIDELGKP